MEKYSYFIEKKAMFGSFPNQKLMEHLDKLGVDYFINLTYDHEKKIKPYKTDKNTIHFPIKDHDIPNNLLLFSKFILKLIDIIKNKDNIIYIHCKGGHGRSGIVVACLLSLLFKIDGENAITLTTQYHNTRTDLKHKWKMMGSPQTKKQKIFVKKFTNPFYFVRSYKNGKSEGFSNFSSHKISIANLGNFNSSICAYNAYVNSHDKKYVNKQEMCLNPYRSKYIEIKNNKIISDTEKIEIMYTILKHKFQQNQKIKKNLMNTFLRPIINKNNDEFWGTGKTGNGKNHLGYILTQIRNEFLCN